MLAGGVLGTAELLLACRDRWGTLPRLSSALGQGLLTNSESLVAITQPRAELRAGLDLRTDGSTITTDVWPDAHTHVTQNRLPDSYAVYRLLFAPLVEDGPGSWAAYRARGAPAPRADRPGHGHPRLERAHDHADRDAAR